MSKYIAPKFLFQSFTCPFCNCVSTMTWKELMLYQEIHPLITDGPLTSFSGFVSALCHNHFCTNRTIWKVTKFADVTNDLDQYQELPTEAEMIYPTFGLAPPPAEDMPESARIDYNEAALIFKISPRSASALLRLATQKIFIELEKKHNIVHDESKKEHLDTIIKSFTNSGILDQTLNEAANSLRLTGNNAVHPGKLELDHITEITTVLFEFINIIVYELISKPQKINDTYKKIKQKK